MFKKTLKVLSLVAVLGLSANANDLLADISKGAISDSSLGVKVLNTEEMNKVRGGYQVYGGYGNGYAFVIALPDINTELMYRRLENGQIIQKDNRGLCPINTTNCYSNSSLETHYITNQNRMLEYELALQAGGYANTYTYALAYLVTAKTNASGYTIYSYSPAAYNFREKSLHPFTSSAILNNNVIIKELRDNYKSELEYISGLK